MTALRELTPEGIERAREFLARLREHPDSDRTPPPELLEAERYSRSFDETVTIEPLTFRTRRGAGEYLSEALEPVRHHVTDHVGIWSWLGMYYFADIVRVKDGRVLLHADESSLMLGGRADQRRYRHYLWSAWRLYEQHGENVAFLLNRPVTDSGDIAKAILDYPRVFNSRGVPRLVMDLYTDGDRMKRGFSTRKRTNGPPPKPGNVWHLIERVLPQLELTYDVYGMKPDALLAILPEPFHAWARAGVRGPGQ